MSILDFKAFLQELLRRFDETLDVSDGSKADSEVIQPILRRMGPDPFATDVHAFLLDRLNQEFPDTATQDGDAITDMLVKPSELLFDPISREHSRVRRNLSLKDPSTLSIDEAESLGANFFSNRLRGNTAHGPVRIYYAQPQKATVSPANVAMSRGGLSFLPTEVQSISTEEMLFNVEGSEYYFDVQVIAEQPGEQYNIEPGEIVSIKGLNASVRVTNKVRFKDGKPEETAVEYIQRTGQSLGEQSLVTVRGQLAVLPKSFPELTRMAIVGMGDPEMRRDILQGGGLGRILASGGGGVSLPDDENQALTRRFSTNNTAPGAPDFTDLIGPLGAPGKGFVLTLIGGNVAYDIAVRRVISATTVDLEEQVLPYGGGNVYWTLRRRELTVSGIPGGILFPDSPQGTVTIEEGEVHVGGATDTFVRGTTFDTASLILDGVTDDTPVLHGLSSGSAGGTDITLLDLTLGTNYQAGDATYLALGLAAERSYELVIRDGVGAGSYRILGVTQVNGSSPVVTVIGSVPAFASARWSVLDEIDVDLIEPKEVRLEGSDLNTFQGVSVVTTGSALNFDEYGVAKNDVLRLLTGPDKGDFVVNTVTPFPAYAQLVLDRPMTSTSANVKFQVFRSNKAGGIERPLVRVTGIDLLDTSSQPVGSKVPFARSVGAYATAFSNPARGLKIVRRDGLVGIVSVDLSGGANVNGLTLEISAEGSPVVNVTFSGVDPIALSDVIDQINTAAGRVLAGEVRGSRFGIHPIADDVRITAGTAVSTLFGGNYALTSRDFRSEGLEEAALQKISPRLDPDYDVVHMRNGVQPGFYTIFDGPAGITPPPGFVQVPGLVRLDRSFAPDAGVEYTVGARSLGTVRVYFLEPTTVEFRVDKRPPSRFTTTLSDGQVLHFFPDPHLTSQRIPALPSGAKPHDGAVSAPGVSTFTASTDFLAKGIRRGDRLIVDFIPITGTVVLADPVPSLALTTLVIEIGETEKTITFVNDSNLIAATDVTRAGVVAQINGAAGKAICKLTGGNYLEFDAEVAVSVRATGTSNALLGFSTLGNTSNEAANAGTYRIRSVTTGSVEVEETFASAETRLQFKVVRPFCQRIGATEMSENLGPVGLYYVDLELVSEGSGDVYNIPEGTFLVPENYEADGYWLETGDKNLSLSPVEPLRLHLSRTLNEVGTDDDLENATKLAGQNLQISYEVSRLTSGLQGFLNAETERVVCASPLARHLLPHFIRFDVVYSGGPREADAKAAAETTVHAKFPNEQLEVSDITDILTQRGSTSIQNPITLYAVVHENDRTIRLERSQDRINLGRLAAFIPERLTFTRKVLLLLGRPHMRREGRRKPLGDLAHVAERDDHACVRVEHAVAETALEARARKKNVGVAGGESVLHPEKVAVTNTLAARAGELAVEGILLLPLPFEFVLVAFDEACGDFRVHLLEDLRHRTSFPIFLPRR